MENLTYIREVAHSMKLNDLKEPAIIISASGMAEAGRIRHHLKNHIGNPENLILFIGYCAEHTLGAQILAGRNPVNIFGEPHEVRARIASHRLLLRPRGQERTAALRRGHHRRHQEDLRHPRRGIPGARLRRDVARDETGRRDHRSLAGRRAGPVSGTVPRLCWPGRPFRWRLAGRLGLLVVAIACAPLAERQVRAAEQIATNEWVLDIGSRSDSSPAIGPDGTIYFGTWNGRLWAVNPEGTRKWIFRTHIEIQSSPAVSAAGTIYFGCRDRKLYALDPDGSKRWEFTTGAWVDASPALAQDGTIYFGSWDGNLYALDPNGSKRWGFRTGGPVVSSAAVGTNGTIYFGSHDAKFYALTPGGKKLWEFAAGGPILSSPALDRDGGIYFTSVDGFLYALHGDGSLRWRLRTGGITESSPVIGRDGTIYVGVNRELWAVTRDGKRSGMRRVEDSIEAAPLAFADGSVGFVARNGRLDDVDPETVPIWTFYLGQSGRACPAVEATGTIYAPGNWRNFYAIRARAPLARTAWPKDRGNSRNTGNVGDAVR